MRVWVRCGHKSPHDGAGRGADNQLTGRNRADAAVPDHLYGPRSPVGHINRRNGGVGQHLPTGPGHRAGHGIHELADAEAGKPEPGRCGLLKHQAQRAAAWDPFERYPVDLLQVIAQLGIDERGTEARVEHRAGGRQRANRRKFGQWAAQRTRARALVQISAGPDPAVPERCDRPCHPDQVVTKQGPQPPLAVGAMHEGDVPAEVVPEIAVTSGDAQSTDDRVLVRSR